MTLRLPLNVLYNNDSNVVTFIKTNGQNPAVSLLKYLEEEFPLAPTVELLKLILPDIDTFLYHETTHLIEVEGLDGAVTKAHPDDEYWKRVEHFKTSYKLWVKEISTARYS